MKEPLNYKAVLVTGSREGCHILRTISSSLYSQGVETSFEQRDQSLLVHDGFFDVDYKVVFLNSAMWSCPEFIRGRYFSEILYVPRANLTKYAGGLIEELKYRTVKPTGEVPRDRCLSLYFKGAYESVDPVWNQEETSLSSKFCFPASLFRREMLQYFENISDPTIEEFLMALSMEGVSGKTPYEKEAILSAEKTLHT